MVSKSKNGTTVAIVGATGFVGLHVWQSLVSRKVDGALALSRQNLDLLNQETWTAVPATTDCVVMAAGLINGTAAQLIQTNVSATIAFAQYCRAIGVRRFVMLSSGAVYGPTDEPTHPDMPANPVTAYGESKLASERLLAETWREQPLAILRLYFPYGKGQRTPRLIPSLVQSIKNGNEIVCRPDGGPILTLTYIKDLADAIVEDFILNEKGGVFNLASTTRLSVEELSLSLASLLGIRPSFRRDGSARDSVSCAYRMTRWTAFSPDQCF